MPTDTTLTIRPIRPEDNAEVAHIIRTVMTEFGAVGEGYSINDPEVDAMFETYDDPRAYFLVLEMPDGRIVGCGGIGPLRGGDPHTCELKKMYFFPETRGQGIGRKLVSILEAAAQKRGYRYMYLETIAAMEGANHLYRRLNFEALPSALGNTGHTSCGLFYGKTL